MKRSDEARAMLQAAGLKVTAERVTLLEALLASKTPASSKDLLGATSGLDRTTVYRSLETFVGAGIARKVDVGHRHAHFEATSGDEHHHLICTSCGKIADVEFCPDPADVLRVLKKAKGFASIESHTLEFHGTCASCARGSK
jgi:Fur family transcriptional regulator, stress-responsive regulator